ncbi:alpha-tocopherol transfer protein-like [Monomorium pharaonis]|uniref:alpha-tocopherol transfer protein-like n=1 Tax=Monomorium pharaonis TaxID=307658 RepID=UPI001746EE1D|nr:alpha-tocopherol transfer protein-like [Monomorium pharaonis]
MSLIRRITLEEEIKKNPKLKLSDIQSLREWCKKQIHLPKIEDSFLALFLHNNYYQMEPTKNTIENYYTIRTRSPEFFCNRDPLEDKGLRQAFKVMQKCFGYTNQIINNLLKKKQDCGYGIRMKI